MKLLPSFRLPAHVAKVLTSPWVLALMMAVPIILLLPFRAERYTISQDYFERIGIGNNKRIYYPDLDYDGRSEKVILFSNQANLINIQILNSNEELISQYCLKDSFNSFTHYLFFADLTGDRINEIIAITKSGDSAFLYVIEMKVPNQFLVEKRFISALGIRDGISYANAYDTQYVAVDLDEDGRQEFVFFY